MASTLVRRSARLCFPTKSYVDLVTGGVLHASPDYTHDLFVVIEGHDKNYADANLRSFCYNGCMKDINATVVLLPKNDPESLLICQICEALKIPMLISPQPHGATLYAETNLAERVSQVHASATTLVIIEIPGPTEESELQLKGFTVKVIDHHRYDGLDRMNTKSSLEQFITCFDIKDADLARAGFDPILVKGVGIIDRSFVWGLTPDICDPVTRVRMIDYYLSLSDQLDHGSRKKTEVIAKEALAQAKIEHGFIIVKNPKPGARIREALSFEIARQYPNPIATLLIDEEVIYVQESSRAKELYEQFGGFMYGGEERCWGKKTDNLLVRQDILKTLGVSLEVLL